MTEPQLYSIVGAAAYAGVMTRTTSITLLIMEITGQSGIIMGVMVGKYHQIHPKIPRKLNFKGKRLTRTALIAL